MLRDLLLCTCLLLLSHSGLLRASSSLVLVSPEDVDSGAIASIIEGIKERDADLEVASTDDPETTILNKGSEVTAVIMLGRSLIEGVEIKQPPVNMVGGGYYGNLSLTPSIRTYSLDPSVSTMVDEILKTGFPLKRLLTVVSNQERKEVVDELTKQLDPGNIQIVVSESKDARSTARAWFELIANLDPASDALWIVDDQHLESSGSYKHIIESAWKNEILVVSALPKFANRGVSIGFVPDLPYYGQFLFDEAIAQGVSKNSGTRYATTRFLRRVYNQRTLEHIGYKLPSDIDALDLDDIIIR